MLLSERGVASLIPLDPDVIEELQDETDRFSDWMEELKNELILQERANK